MSLILLKDNELVELKREYEADLNSHYLVAPLLLEVIKEIKSRFEYYL